LKILYVNIQW